MSALKYWDGAAWQTVGGGGTAPDDTAYAATWDGVTTVAPSKNAVYDELNKRAPSKVVFLTSGTTYTPTTGARALLVECLGGGGGGGQSTASSTQISAGSGGGGGGYAVKYLSGTLKSSYTYAIGAGGAGVGGATSGGATSFDTGPAVCSASGGVLGGTGIASATPAWQPVGGTGGAGSIGDFLSYGQQGQPGMRLSSTQGKGGDGGSSIWGGGAMGWSAAAAGADANGYGGGGAGALSSAATTFWGGAGKQGVIRITEYF